MQCPLQLIGMQCRMRSSVDALHFSPAVRTLPSHPSPHLQLLQASPRDEKWLPPLLPSHLHPPLQRSHHPHRSSTPKVACSALTAGEGDIDAVGHPFLELAGLCGAGAHIHFCDAPIFGACKNKQELGYFRALLPIVRGLQAA